MGIIQFSSGRADCSSSEITLREEFAKINKLTVIITLPSGIQIRASH
jgi:hypothetical protein